jgi:hypothetical protein
MRETMCDHRNTADVTTVISVGPTVSVGTDHPTTRSDFENMRALRRLPRSGQLPDNTGQALKRMRHLRRDI